MITIEGVLFVSETAAAIQIEYEGSSIWLPKSQIEYNDDLAWPGELIDIEVPEWMAVEKGLV